MAPFTVVSFNIRNDRAIDDGRNHWFFRRRAVIEAISKPAPAIVGLQEVRPMQLRYLHRHFSDRFQVVSAGRNDGKNKGEHCTVLVERSRFDVVECKTQWLSNDPEVPGSKFEGARFPRICTMVTVRERATDAEFIVANTHFDENANVYGLRSVTRIAEWANSSGLPWLVIGDMNLRIDSASLEPLWQLGFRDALAELPADGVDAASHHSFKGQTDGDRIDHVLVGPGLQVVGGYIQLKRLGGKLPSDHWPVVAEITF